jgi:hypothetical protein
VGLAKLAWEIQKQWEHIRRGACRYPLLLFLSAGCPRWVSSGELGFVPGEIPGIYTFDWSLPAEVVFVNLRGLPEAPGCSLLKLMPTPRNKSEARTGIDRLRRDTGMIESIKEQVEEALMNGQIPATDDERENVYQRLKREFREEGREEGRREALLTLARRLVDTDELSELEAIEDPDELERRVLARLESR